MVVTSSRLHAVRYKQAIDRYIAEHGYDDIRALVAFSGTCSTTAPAFRCTEQGMNGFPESQTAERFAGPDYQVLVVAEKFQTGFDQPLLHTMYVDKTLVGLAAVQTLSRLNRIHPLKERHVRPRLPQRDRHDRRGVRAVLRRHGRAADRPEHAVRHARAARALRRAARRRDRRRDAGAPRSRPAARNSARRRLTQRSARRDSGSRGFPTRSGSSSATR